MHRIVADLLIPGDGEPIQNGVVVLDGQVISYAGPAAAAPDTPGATVHRAAAVLPGLWDCHGHLTGSRTFDLARAVAEGMADGPAIYPAGAILSTTGGHADLHSYRLTWVEQFSASDGTLRLADGIPECMRAVREQLRAGARVIKVCASGGVLSEVDHPVHQQFTAEELRAIVEVAGMADRVVAAHCHGKPGILAALEAGCRTIEHGSYLDEECCDAMRESGAILVPTRTIIGHARPPGRGSAVC